LVEANPEKPQDELVEGTEREISSSVEIALPRRVGVVHHPLVFGPAFEPARKAARDGPKPVRADPCNERHCMAHQSAHASVAIGEGMNVVEPVVCRGHRHQPPGCAKGRQPIALRKMRHEVRNTSARRRLVPTDGNLVLRARTPFARDHHELAAGTSNAQHVLRRILVELTVQPAQEIGVRRLAELSFRGQAIDLRLKAHVCRGLDLQVTSLLVPMKFADERAFYILWACVMAFDKVAVIGIRDPHEVSEVCGGARMERLTKLRRRGDEIGDGIGQRLGRLLEPRWLNALDGFKTILTDCMIHHMFEHKGKIGLAPGNWPVTWPIFQGSFWPALMVHQDIELSILIRPSCPLWPIIWPKWSSNDEARLSPVPPGLRPFPPERLTPEKSILPAAKARRSVIGMKQHLTERFVKAMLPGAARDLLVFDDEVAGFGLCVYRSGKRAFILRYRIVGRERRLTIGSWPDWSVTAAREEAKRLKREVDAGNDPLGKRIERRNAPTMSDLIDRYLREHAVNLAPRSFSDRTSLLRKLVEPEWGTRKVAEITPEDVDRLLAKIAKGRPRPRKHPPKLGPRRPAMKGPFKPTPIRANRVGEILRKMFNLAIRWQMRPDNPVVGFSRFPELPRERFLSADEIKRLADVLAEHPNCRCANVIRLILLTGVRRGEAMSARWEQFDLENGIWTKPAATTKQRRLHRAPLSRAAVELLRTIRAGVPPDCPWVFPGDKKGPLREMQTFWEGVREKAKLGDARIHDLRHTFASLLVSGGMTLPMIGCLLGHTQAQTTFRYAHLYDDPLRVGLDQLGDMLRPKLKLIANDPAQETCRPDVGSRATF
jgi:integrase